MLAALLLVCLGPPAEAAPPGVTDERAVYAEPSNDTLAPIEITPPPEREVVVVAPELAPAPEAPLEVPPEAGPPPLPPPPPPPSGAGRLVGASFSIALGVAALTTIAVEGTREDGNPEYIAATFIPLGAAGIGIGAYLLVRGVKARANFNEWRAYTQSNPRPSGEGLLVAGVMGTVVGGVTVLGAAVASREPSDGPGVPIAFAVGGTMVAVGIGSLTWGLLRRGQYHSWRQSTFLSTRSMPIVTPLRRGLGVGWAARF